MKLNVWQKVCIAVGAVVIALMFLVFPVVGTKIIDNPNYNPKVTQGFGFLSSNPKMEVKFNDYKATSYRAVGVLAAAGALTILLGFVKEAEKEQAKGGA